jgi:hypothetical protein
MRFSGAAAGTALTGLLGLLLSFIAEVGGLRFVFIHPS